MDFIALFKEGGLVLVFAVVLCVILFAVIRHFITQSERIFNAFLASQEKFAEISAGWQRALDTHNANATDFHTRAAEADRFQREEHREICAGIQTVLATFREEHNKRHEEIGEVRQELKGIGKIIEKCER